MSVLSTSRTSGSVTAVAVCVTGRVPPSSSSGADGEPGRQVDEVVALEQDPRADLELGVLAERQRVVAQLHRHAAPAPSPFDSSFVTLPTSTPAIRTGEPDAEVAGRR